MIPIKGFILPFVLIFLYIFSLISLSSLMTISRLIKRQVHTWQRIESMLRSKQIIQYLEARLAAGSTLCMIPQLASAEIIKKPISWWQSHTCHGNLYPIRYYYAVELLESNPCWYVVSIDNQKVTAIFYRITLLALPGQTTGSKIRLQSTMAIASNAVTTCQNKLHQVRIGHQMWREL